MWHVRRVPQEYVFPSLWSSLLPEKCFGFHTIECMSETVDIPFTQDLGINQLTYKY
jgi:hypothetical protein